MAEPATEQSAAPLHLPLEEFASLGEYAEAGRLAVANAIEEAQKSAKQGRIPIAGAVVVLSDDGQLVNIAVGHNGRIPGEPDDVVSPKGYPSDHGETGCLRCIKDFGNVDWSRAVFATTLSPCIMCTRSIIHLHSLGLSRVVIAESHSFPGRKDLLRSLKNPPMDIVELTNKEAIEDMARFATRYPWDWAADIGEVPPTSQTQQTDLHVTPPDVWASIESRLRKLEHSVGVVQIHDWKLLGSAPDDRQISGGNPVRSGVMQAMGRAGSAINIRDCCVVFIPEAHASDGDVPASRPITLDEFGLSSLGACELFRPSGVVFLQGAPAKSLRAALNQVGVGVVLATKSS